MTIVKLQTMRRLLLSIRNNIDAIVAVVEAELRERGALHDRTINERNYQQSQ